MSSFLRSAVTLDRIKTTWTVRVRPIFAVGPVSRMIDEAARKGPRLKSVVAGDDVRPALRTVGRRDIASSRVVGCRGHGVLRRSATRVAPRSITWGGLSQRIPGAGGTKPGWPKGFEPAPTRNTRQHTCLVNERMILMSDTSPEVRPHDSTDVPGDAVRRAAALGPLPGIHDEDEAAADEADHGATAGTSENDAAVGTSADDEAESVIGFRGLRS